MGSFHYFVTMQQTLERAIKVLIYATFFVPIVVMPASFIFPFIVPKIVIFRTLVTIMAGCYGLLLLSNFQKYAPKQSPLMWAVGLFILSFAISTFTGVDTYHSFWDNHERMLGLFTIMHYALYFVIVSVFLKTWSDWKLALQIFLLAGSVVMVIGVMQVANPQLLLNQGSDRVASTLGNSIYVGGYGLFLFFVAALLFLKEKNIIWRIIEAVAALFAILGLFYSGTRGSFLGWIAGLVVVLVLYSILLKEHQRLRHVLWGIGIASLVAFGFLFANRQSDFVKNIPTVGRVFTTTWEGVKSSPRFLAWNIAVQSWKERPLFGWGPNNFFYAYNQHYNPRALEYGYGETWFDNAHNIILNTLSVQGLVGVIAYLYIYIAAGLMLVVAYRKQLLNREIFIIALAFLVSHLVQNITVFENPTSYLYFMFWLAMVVGLSRDKSADTEGSSKPVTVVHLVSVGTVVVILGFVFNVLPANANMMTIKALRALGTNPVQAITSIKEAMQLSTPHVDDIRNDLSHQGLNLVSQYNQQIGKEKSTELLDIFEEGLQKNLILHPRDIRVHLTLNQLYSIRLAMTNDARWVIKSETIAEDSLKYSPRRQQIIYSLSTIKLQLGKTKEAVDMLEKTIADDPKIVEGYLRAAVANNILGQPEKSRELLVAVKRDAKALTPEENNTWNDIMSRLPPPPATSTKKTK